MYATMTAFRTVLACAEEIKEELVHREMFKTKAFLLGCRQGAQHGLIYEPAGH